MVSKPCSLAPPDAIKEPDVMNIDERVVNINERLVNINELML